MASSSTNNSRIAAPGLNVHSCQYKALFAAVIGVCRPEGRHTVFRLLLLFTFVAGTVLVVMVRGIGGQHLAVLGGDLHFSSLVLAGHLYFVEQLSLFVLELGSSRPATSLLLGCGDRLAHRHRRLRKVDRGVALLIVARGRGSRHYEQGSYDQSTFRVHSIFLSVVEFRLSGFASSWFVD